MKIQVTNMESPRTGLPVANQYVIITGDGIYFQSYQTVVAMLDNSGKIWVKENAWEYSKTTSKYLSEWFCNYTVYNGMTKKQGEKLMRDGVFGIMEE